MNRIIKFILFTTIIVFTGSRGLSYSQSEIQDKPNIIFILVDDMGWNGVSSFGNKHVSTPNIDRLAEQGMKFTEAYVAPECTPTRGELLSGQYAARTGITQVHVRRTYPNAPLITPEVPGKLPEDNYTVANMLRDAGYATAISGKWHVGDGSHVANIKKRFGMEYFETYGFDFAGDAVHSRWFDNYEDYSDEDKEKAGTDIVNDIIRFVREKENRPFFAYMSFYSPHTPILAPDSISQEFIENGYPKTTELFGDATEKPTADYAGMIKYLDHSIGKLLDNLDEMGLTEETMIVFMSDNGGLNRAWNNIPLRGAKGVLYEGGIRVPMIVQWPGKVAAASKSNTPVHIVDLYRTFKEVAGGNIPKDKTLDGVSLLPVLRSQNEIQERDLYWHHPHYIHDYGKTPASAVRSGDFKLIYYYGDYLNTRGHLPVRGQPYGDLLTGERIELFNVKEDPREQHDLSGEMPEKADKLLKKLKNKLGDLDAPMPRENPKADLTSWYETAVKD